MRVRLTRKLANEMDGVDVTHANVGDVLELHESQAQLLIAEGWAVQETSRVLQFASVNADDDRNQDDEDVSRAS
jgi:hypothetical protein